MPNLIVYFCSKNSFNFVPIPNLSSFQNSCWNNIVSSTWYHHYVRTSDANISYNTMMLPRWGFIITTKNNIFVCICLHSFKFINWISILSIIMLHCSNNATEYLNWKTKFYRALIYKCMYNFLFKYKFI